MDESDFEIATRMIEKEIEAGIHSVRRRKSDVPQRPDGTCVDCDQQIPTARAVLGFARCVPCQSKREQRK